MIQARDNLLDNLGRARDLRALCVTLAATTAGTMDLTDILRAALVMAVSALDNYIHRLARVGMVEIYNGTRARTDAYGRFRVSMDNVAVGIGAPGSTGWLEDEILQQHGWLSFRRRSQGGVALRQS